MKKLCTPPPCTSFFLVLSGAASGNHKINNKLKNTAGWWMCALFTCFFLILHTDITHIAAFKHVLVFYNVNDIRFVFSFTPCTCIVCLFASFHLFLSHGLMVHFNAMRRKWNMKRSVKMPQWKCAPFFKHLKFLIQCHQVRTPAVETQTTYIFIRIACYAWEGCVFFIHSLKFIVYYKNRVITAWNYLLGFTKGLDGTLNDAWNYCKRNHPLARCFVIVCICICLLLAFFLNHR